MARVPTPSQTPFPVVTASVTPTRAKTSPTRAPKSSSTTTISSGARACRMNCGQLWSPRLCADSCTAVRSENDSSTTATPSTTKAQTGDSMCSGFWTLWKPSYRANTPPSRKMTIATRNAYR